MREGLLDKLDCPNCRAGAGLASVALERDPCGRIRTGVLGCAGCGAWFPVIGRVADLVPDALREPGRDAVFLAAHGEAADRALRDVVPGPALRPVRAERSPRDRAVLDDANYWGAFMQRHWDIGDRAIFDIRTAGTHPTYWTVGILETDDRDSWQRFGLLPDRLGRRVFPWLGREFAGRWGIDIGCGGGQFGLEAARQGVLMVGTDPSWNNLRLGAEYAESQGVAIDFARIDSGAPPFKNRSFDLMIAMDSLHHIPGLAEAFPRLEALVADGGQVAAFEHVGRARLKHAVLRRVAAPLMRKILRRYPKGPVPPELLAASANEDVGMDEVMPVLRARLDPIDEAGEMLLYWDVEALAHYAFGKRRWFTRLVRQSVLAFERLAQPFQPVEHWWFRGRVRR